MNEFVESFNINFAVILTWTVSLSIVIFGSIILLGSKRVSSKIFSFTILTLAVWNFFMGIDVGIKETNDQTILQILNFIPRFTYFFGGVLIMFLYYFMITFPEKDRNHKVEKGIIAITILSFPFYFFTDLIVGGNNVTWIGNNNIIGAEMWNWTTGPLNVVYSIFFNSLFLLGIASLLKRAISSTDLKIREQTLITFWALIAGIAVPSLVNIFLPLMGVYSYNWVGTLIPIVWISILGYSIMKYDNMNVRIVTAEILVSVILFLLFLNIFI